MTHFIEWLSAFIGALMIIGGFLWFGMKLIEWILRACKGYRYFCEYIWHRHQFMAWLKENCTEVKEKP